MAAFYILLNVLFIYAVLLESMKGVLAIGALAATHLFGPTVAGFFSAAMPFPNGAHDDQVDAMTQALLRWITIPVQPRFYVDEDEYERLLADQSCLIRGDCPVPRLLIESQLHSAKI